MALDGKNALLSRNAFIFKAFYFFYWSAAVIKMAYPPVYFKQLGLGASYVGVLSGTVPFIRGVSAPLVAYLADKTNKRKTVFLVSVAAHTVTPILLLIPRPGKHLCSSLRKNQYSSEIVTNLNKLQNSGEDETYLKIKHEKYNHTKQIHSGRGEEMEVSTSEHPHRHNSEIPSDSLNGYIQQESSDGNANDLLTIFLILLAFYTVGEFVGAPARNLADSALLETLGSESSKYGEYRLWGNVGQIILYAAITLTASYIHIQPSCELSIQEDYGMSMYAITLFMVIAFTFALPINFKQDSYSENISLTARTKEVSLKDTLLNFRSVTLIITVFYLGIVDGTLFTFKFWYLTDIGSSRANWAMGVTGVARCIAATIMFGLSGKVIKASGVLNTIHASLSIYVFAFVLFGVITDPWLAIVPEVIQGVAFAISMPAAILCFIDKSPQSLAATMQGK